MKFARLSSAVAVLAAVMMVPQLSAAQENSSQERERRDRAQQQKQQKQQKQKQQQQKQREEATSTDRRDREARSGRQQKEVTRQGEILRLKRVDIRGRDTKHLVALVKTQEGKRGVVDLGPVSDLKRLKLRQGDRISFQGTPLRVGERGVLMADRVKKEGQRARPERAERERQVARRAVRQSDLGARLRSEARAERREQRQQRRRPARLRGRVERAKRVGVRHLDTDHLVLLLRTDRDRLRIVDLGPVENLQNVRLVRGDTIAVAGDVALVGDRSVLMARRFRKGDRDYRIGRNENQSQQGSAQSRSRSQESRSQSQQQR